jgi:hypothetical protein
MRRRLIPALLLALATLGPARAATTVYPAATLSLSPTEKVSIQLTVETGTYSVDSMVFIRKYSYTLKNLSSNGYRVSGFNPDCDNPFGADPAVVTPPSKSSGWQKARFPLDSPADYVWFTLTGQNASALGNGESVKVALYSNDPPGIGEIFLRGLAPVTSATRHDSIRYWHPDCGAALEVPKTGLPVVPHGPFDLAQAYPAKPAGYSGASPAIAPNNSFSGAQLGPANANAVAGVLCLDTVDVEGLPVLNVAAFATCPPGQYDPYVQSYRLIKRVPGSDKCPLTYAPQIFTQYGTGIRTWWALRYTQPGTTFTLEVTVRCRDLTRGGASALHIDRWTWRVVATLESLPHVIDVLHTRAIGTLEIPCIVGEDAYRALLTGADQLKTAAANMSKSARARVEAQNALIGMEALLLANAAFGEVVTPEGWFMSFPPGNKTELGQRGYAGILESLENPCVCKLIADLEYIGKDLGIVS